MNNIGFIINLQYIPLDFILYIIKTFFISVCTYYIFTKISNYKNTLNFKLIILYISMLIISILSSTIKYNYNSFAERTFLIFMLGLIFSINTKNKVVYSILLTFISLSINYILYFIVLIISFFINLVFTFQNDYITLCLIIIIHSILLNFLFKIRKIKNGFIFLQSNIQNEYFEMLILNISITMSFAFIVLSNFSFLRSLQFFFAFIIFSIIMFITIKKSFEMYYKQKLLIQDLEETKAELKQKEEEIKNLEKENLNFSKTSHSISHKQKSLEYKLNQLLLRTEIASELDITDKVKEISNTYFNNTAVAELPKTNITEIDDMLKFMQSECVKNNIDFKLQINDNIYPMINNYIDKENLEILLADFIKNSIIAINYSDNINRSIFVRLGLIDGIYSLYVYDSGIEFEIDTLLHLGQMPYTTHADNGGTGIGFMNTFDTLRKFNASMIINEINSPTSDNYTKVIMIKFDKQNSFKISSYRSEEIKNKNIESNFAIE